MANRISRITIRIDPLRGGKRIEALGKVLTDEAALAQLLVRALSRSVSKAIRRRFLEAQYHMVGMEKETDPSNQDEFAVLSARIARLQELRDQAYVEDRVEAAKRLNTRILKLNTSGTGRLKVDTHGVGGDLSTGKYRKRMKEVLKLLVDTPVILTTSAGSATVGVSPLEQLNKIPTPSAAPLVGKGKSTNSAFKVLWRQLEFGTGIFSTTHARGDWWFGPYPGAGLHVRGNRPGSFLRSASGVPYDDDAIRFKDEFIDALNAALGV